MQLKKNNHEIYSYLLILSSSVTSLSLGYIEYIPFMSIKTRNMHFHRAIVYNNSTIVSSPKDSWYRFFLAINGLLFIQHTICSIFSVCFWFLSSIAAERVWNYCFFKRFKRSQHVADRQYLLNRDECYYVHRDVLECVRPNCEKLLCHILISEVDVRMEHGVLHVVQS